MIRFIKIYSFRKEHSPITKNEKNNVEIINVSKSYNKNVVIKNISLDVPIGSRIGIVGPNGTGKTTICEMISQLRAPTSGTINIKDDLKLECNYKKLNIRVVLLVEIWHNFICVLIV